MTRKQYSVTTWMKWGHLSWLRHVKYTISPIGWDHMQWLTWPGTPGSCCSRKPSTSRWPQLRNASTGTQGLSSLDAGWLPWEDRRTRPTEQVWHPLTDWVRTVIAVDAERRHKNDTFPLRTIFAPKKTGATRSNVGKTFVSMLVWEKQYILHVSASWEVPPLHSTCHAILFSCHLVVLCCFLVILLCWQENSIA